MYRVSKEIKFCFGHRLLEYPGKCRNLHGHNARALVTIATNRLDHLGMATEFADIKRSVGEWVDSNLDHRAILHKDDPLATRLAEHGEPPFVLDVNPTTENLAKLFFEQAQAAGLPVVEVALWENDSSCATYSPTGAGGRVVETDDESAGTSPAARPYLNAKPTAPMPARRRATGGGEAAFLVTREFKFCFGHRLLNYPGKCKRPHGHNGRLIVAIESPELDALGMGIDFTEIKRVVGGWLENNLDHAMILHRDDPLVSVLREFDNKVLVLDENPTTENVARMLHGLIADAGLNVAAVQFWETDFCGAVYAPALLAPTAAWDLAGHAP